MSRLKQALSWVGAAALGGLVVAVLGAAGAGSTAEYEKLVIRRPNGQSSITLEARADGGLRLDFSRSGARPIEVDLDGDGVPSITLRNGHRQIHGTVTPTRSLLFIRDGREQEVITLGELDRDGATIKVNDTAGNTYFRARAPVYNDPNPEAPVREDRDDPKR